MTEVWRYIPGYEDYYQVSNTGNVKSLRSGKILKAPVASNGYTVLNLCFKGQKMYTVHSLVALAFMGDSTGKTINHRDGNKLNNNLDNLEIVSYRDNNIHALERGLRGRKIKPNDVPNINTLFSTGFTKSQLSRLYRVNIKTIDNVLNNKLMVCEAYS